MYKLSCRLELLSGNTVLEKLISAKNFGFDAVALPGRFLNEYINDLRLTYKDSPLPFSSISLGFEGSLISNSESVRKKCSESILRIFDLCEEFSIPYFNMPPALLQDNIDIPDNENEIDNLLIEAIPMLADEAKKRNVVFLLEPVNRYESKYLNTLEHSNKICEKINHNNFGITADLFHMQIEEKSFESSIKTAAKWIKYIHIAENTRVEPGAGSMDFDSAFSALDKIGYSGFIEIESRSLSGAPEVVLPKSVTFIKSKLLEGAKK